jgi:ATP-dependent Clp protease ATP-binding subunit ClpC
MFERYSERARRVVFWARYFAGQVGSREIETEHLLLGLLREDMRLAARFLGSPWALEEVWREVEQRSPVRGKPLGPVELPLSNASKRVLSFAAEEADRLFSKNIGSGHLLLGLLREKKCIAERILQDRGIHLTATREDLARTPHNDSVSGEFVRERGQMPADVVEVQARIRVIRNGMKEAIADHDFAEARARSNEEREELYKLYLLCQQHGLSDWLYE